MALPPMAFSGVVKTPQISFVGFPWQLPSTIELTDSVVGFIVTILYCAGNDYMQVVEVEEMVVMDDDDDYDVK